MLRTGLIVFMFGGVMAWAQAQDSTPAPTDKVDRASAYYHYALAQYYSQLGLADKAKENYQEAVKADPQAPPLLPRFHPPFITPPKPLPPAPKSSPSPQQK